MTTAVHGPLRDTQREARAWTPPLDIALLRARETLAEQQSANIHDDREMLDAAVTLETALRDLVAALDVEATR